MIVAVIIGIIQPQMDDRRGRQNILSQLQLDQSELIRTLPIPWRESKNGLCTAENNYSAVWSLKMRVF